MFAVVKIDIEKLFSVVVRQCELSSLERLDSNGVPAGGETITKLARKENM